MTTQAEFTEFSLLSVEVRAEGFAIQNFMDIERVFSDKSGFTNEVALGKYEVPRLVRT